MTNHLEIDEFTRERCEAGGCACCEALDDVTGNAPDAYHDLTPTEPCEPMLPQALAWIGFVSFVYAGVCGLALLAIWIAAMVMRPTQ